MADEIQVSSKGSPRFDGRTLKWFSGNTFPYALEIELIDGETGEPIELGENDYIMVRFYDRRNNLIHEFEFKNLTMYEVGGKKYVEVVMNFTDEVSAKFEAGKYNYCTTYYGTYVTTIWDNADAEVEQCH